MENTTVSINPKHAEQFAALVKEKGFDPEPLLQSAMDGTLKNMIEWMREHGVVDDLGAFAAANIFQRKIKSTRRKTAKVQMRINVGAASYGMLAEASIILGCSVQQALEIFVSETDALPEWTNYGCDTV